MKFTKRDERNISLRLNRDELIDFLRKSIDYGTNAGLDEEITIRSRIDGKYVEILYKDILENSNHLPKYLEEVDIDIKWLNANDRKIEASVSIKLDKYTSEIIVSGENEIWVSGKCEQIYSYLRSLRSRFWFLHTRFFSSVNFLANILFFIVLIGVLIEFFKSGLSGALQIISSRLVWGILVIFYLTEFLNSHKKVKIFLRSKKSFVDKYSQNEWSFYQIVTAVAIFILGSIFALMLKIY